MYVVQLYRVVFGEEKIVTEQPAKTLTEAVKIMNDGLWIAGPGNCAGRIKRA